jgi:dihydroorotase
MFEVCDSDVTTRDSMGYEAHLARMIEPRWTVLGSEVIEASPYQARRPSALSSQEACPHCGWVKPR